ncbi:hypothetical protein LOTGIDRAFT_237329 [Lottia gigantea]|uniref:GH26 domain-containing protein n=1 Tax=Lottia gigantea TaxID=225164 RepID=V4B310_LOTGI|nr:hypothetical protein LOTGIDRAFT_237329 [Lottia gigantea]ESP04593.1 hypothetical protein LOTGIDRAFT_237329 [Lottia gigantea]
MSLLIKVSYFLLLTYTVVAGPSDQYATQLTKNLFNNLKKIAADPTKILFGQHKANYAGAGGGHTPYKTHNHDGQFVGWEFSIDMAQKKLDGELCDIKQMTGEFPAFTGYDFYQFESNWMEIVTHLVKKSYSRGMVVAMSWHMHNFADGGDPWHWGSENRMVKEMLPGGRHQHHYMAMLDKIANWANELKDSKGQHIPIIFRPFHESNGKWFWWGLGNSIGNTPQDLKDIYRYTVKYLRDTKHVHNFLYAFSPNSGYKSMMQDGSSQKSYMAAYPGDDYVDILGLDDYSLVLQSSTLQNFVDTVAGLVKMADRTGKIPALTEIGAPNNHLNEKSYYNFWISNVLNPLKGIGVQANDAVKRIAYINTWTNQCGTNCKIFTPYHGHPAETDFINFYKDPMMAFENYVKQHNMYA